MHNSITENAKKFMRGESSENSTILVAAALVIILTNNYTIFDLTLKRSKEVRGHLLLF